MNNIYCNTTRESNPKQIFDLNFLKSLNSNFLALCFMTVFYELLISPIESINFYLEMLNEEINLLFFLRFPLCFVFFFPHWIDLILIFLLPSTVQCTSPPFVSCHRKVWVQLKVSILFIKHVPMRDCDTFNSEEFLVVNTPS